MNGNLNRRGFLGTAGALVVASAMPGWARSANERLRVGVIGLGNRGRANWTGVSQAGADIVALCDVDENMAGPAREAFPKAKFYKDFRKMIDDAQQLDAVVVSTPDHSHAMPSVLALRAGLHLYCEKPLTHNVAEARLVTEEAAKHKRVTQMGTQIHAGENYRRVVEIIQSGAIGPVSEVHVWCAKSWGGGSVPKDMPPVPKGLDWDLWLGPAADRPYHSTYHPFNWRRWWDFGGGTLADMACHYVDLPFWALKLKYPTHVKATGPEPNPHTAALALTVEYQYPARDELPPVKLTWYDGGRRPKQFDEGQLPKWGDGVLFVGEKGMLVANYGSYKLFPEEKFADYKAPEPSIPRSIGHHREWVEACLKGEATTTCDFRYSGPLAETALLGNVAYRCGQALEWDGEQLKAKGTPEADAFIHREYRKGWELS